MHLVHEVITLTPLNVEHKVAPRIRREPGDSGRDNDLVTRMEGRKPQRVAVVNLGEAFLAKFQKVIRVLEPSQPQGELEGQPLRVRKSADSSRYA
jgi:hypothetical protein